MRGVAEYKTVSLESATNEQLVVMLFEAAVRHQYAAQADLSANDISSMQAHLAKTRKIFSEVLVALDHESAPDLCASLASLYKWVITELSKIGSSKDADALDGVIRVTENILDAWQKAMGVVD